MKVKKILIFSLAYYPSHVGGAEVAIKEITDRISDDDISFDMVTLRFDKNLPEVEKIGNVTIYRIGFTADNPGMSDLVKWPLKLNKFLFPFTAWRKASKLHAKNNYDGIWAMMAAYAGFAAMFFKWTHKDVPYLLTLQEGDPIPYIKQKVRHVYFLFERIFQKADMIQVISTYLGRWARDMGFKGTLEIVPNAVNTKHFSQEFSAQELNVLKEKLGKTQDQKYVITTSRLVKKNAADDVIKALALLPSHIIFVVLGIGPDLEMLKKLAQENGVADRVMFLGQVDHKEMPKYLKISDVFIRPSLSEGFGNSFVEAMASDLPVIATQEGGIADFLFDPDKNPDKAPTGLAVDPRSPKQIAKQIKRFLEDTALTEKIKTNAKKLAFEKYDWNLIARDMRKKVFNVLLK